MSSVYVPSHLQMTCDFCGHAGIDDSDQDGSWRPGFVYKWFKFIDKGAEKDICVTCNAKIQKAQQIAIESLRPKPPLKPLKKHEHRFSKSDGIDKITMTWKCRDCNVPVKFGKCHGYCESLIPEGQVFCRLCETDFHKDPDAYK